MQIIINVNKDKAILTTEVNGAKVEYGMAKVDRGYYSQCTEKYLDDYEELTDEQWDALNNIKLEDLIDAFSE